MVWRRCVTGVCALALLSLLSCNTTSPPAAPPPDPAAISLQPGDLPDDFQRCPASGDIKRYLQFLERTSATGREELASGWRDLQLNGAKFGCGLAQCGACTVIIDGRPVRSCITEIGSLANAEIVTIEGLGTTDKPHPIQQAFIDEQSVQCGYCINGMIMSAKALLDASPRPSEQDVRNALASNLCRCGTHGRIIRAVLRAAQEIGKT